MITISSRFALLLAFCLAQSSIAMPASPVMSRNPAFISHTADVACRGARMERIAHKRESSDELVYSLSSLESDSTYHHYAEDVEGARTAHANDPYGVQVITESPCTSQNGEKREPTKADSTLGLETLGMDTLYHKYSEPGKDDSVVSTKSSAEGVEYHKYTEKSQSTPSKDDSLLHLDLLGLDTLSHNSKDEGKDDSTFTAKYAETGARYHKYEDPSKGDSLLALDLVGGNALNSHEYKDASKHDSSTIYRFGDTDGEYHRYTESTTAESTSNDGLLLESLGLGASGHEDNEHKKEDSKSEHGEAGADYHTESEPSPPSSNDPSQPSPPLSNDQPPPPSEDQTQQPSSQSKDDFTSKYGNSFAEYRTRTDKAQSSTPSKDDSTIRLDSLGANTVYHTYRDPSKDDSTIGTHYKDADVGYHKYTESRHRARSSRAQFNEGSLINFNALGYHEYKEPGRDDSVVGTKYGDTYTGLHGHNEEGKRATGRKLKSAGRRPGKHHATSAPHHAGLGQKTKSDGVVKAAKDWDHQGLHTGNE